MISLSGTSPAPGEKLVAPDTSIEFTLVDDGSGIDISTLVVELKGYRAVEGTSFADGFDGPLSSITPSGDDFAILIDVEEDFTIGRSYGVKIQVQNLNGDYFNTSYAFKIVPQEPVLVSSSPTNNETLTSMQTLFLEFEDTVHGIDENSITVKINQLEYITNGIIDSEHNGALTDINTSGTTIVRIDPIEPLKNGDYLLDYSVADTLGNILSSSLNFSILIPDPPLATNLFAQTGFLGFFQGIERVSDLGCGDSVLIEWNKPVKKNYNNEAFVLVYQNEYRLSVFDSPTYLAIPDLEEATVTSLETGTSLSFGARALEFAKGVLDPTGMEIVDDGFYKIPDSTTLSSQMSASSLLLTTSSSEGYPDAGLLKIGSEVIRYNSLNRNTNTFYIPVNGRGLLGSTPSIYLPGDEVELFLNCTDTNTVIVMSTPTFQDGYGFDRFVNGEGLVVTDYSDNDRVFYQGYDFCGWHDPLPEQTLTGENDADCGSYLGGEFNGLRGFNLYDRMLNREEVLLNNTGEPVILLKRIWDGVTCNCMDGRRLSPKVKSCQGCYGTGYEDGFLQYSNLRREDRRIVVSFDESPEDLLHGEKEHLQQDFEPSAWTTPIPAIRDRDLLLRFDYTEDREFIYEVLNVAKEKIIHRRFGRQRLTLKRLDKTDIVYTFPFNLSRIPIIT